MKRKIILIVILVATIIAAVGIGIAVSTYVIEHPAPRAKKEDKKKEEKKKEDNNKKEDDKKEDPKKETVTITFNTNGGESLEPITVEKGLTKNLPIPGRDGYNFEGWYIGSTLIESDYKYNENVTVTAKWSEDIRTMRISFNSNGGSPVSSIVVTCNKGLTLPAGPTKEGYTFTHWAMANGKEVNNGGIIKCINTTLYAKYEKNKVYTCPEGYKLSGTKCLTCPQGTTLSGSKCLSCPEGYKLSGNSCVYSESALERCPANTEGDNCLSDPTEPTKVCSSGVQKEDKCYVESTEETEEDCTAAGKTWESDKCYTIHTEFKDECPSGTVANGDKCYKQNPKEKYCNEGLTLKDGACTKSENVNSVNVTTIDATEK